MRLLGIAAIVFSVFAGCSSRAEPIQYGGGTLKGKSFYYMTQGRSLTFIVVFDVKLQVDEGRFGSSGAGFSSNGRLIAIDHSSPDKIAIGDETYNLENGRVFLSGLGSSRQLRISEGRLPFEITEDSIGQMLDAMSVENMELRQWLDNDET